MSVTTSPPPPSNLPAKRPSLLARFSQSKDNTPSELMEFYSPSMGVMATPVNPAARNTVLIFGAMVLCIFILFAVIPLERTVFAGGKVITLTPETVVQPITTSIVKTIAVSEGDIVRRGQLLAQLDPTFAAADSTASREQVDRYQTEVDRLTAELHQSAYHPKDLTAGALVQEGIFAQRAAARDAELRYYKGQIEAQRALEAQSAANIRQYAKQTGVAVDVEKMREALERDQVGSRLDTLAAQNARLEAERQVLSSVAQEENARQGVSALEGQLENYNQQWFADISQTVTQDNVQLANYRSQLEHSALNYKLIDLRAEQDSIVQSVAPVSPGSVLQGGQTFFTLVPINAPLEIDAQITADQAGFVYNGQPVEIQFQTLPFSQFGMAYGTVRLISADSFLTNSSAAATGSSPGSTSGTTSSAVFTGVAPTSAFFYDARITLDRLKFKNVPKDFHIVPGMPVSANIKVGERNVWEYLGERFLPIIEEGMREPN